jgi:hypothetical protein
MALWGFSRESNQVASGANTVAAIVKGYRPKPVVAGTSFPGDGNNGDIQVANKRNVIATNKGWVRRVNKRDIHGNQRQFDEVLVAASPGYGLDYTANTYLGNPDICEIYVKMNANNVISANVSANLYVVFNMPVAFKAAGNTITINIANTAGGNNGVARYMGGRANTANNVLVFTMPKLQGGTGSAKATYHVNAQSLSVTGGGNSLYYPEAPVNPTRHAANLVITGAVANNLSNGWGNRITSFQVSPKGV